MNLLSFWHRGALGAVVVSFLALQPVFSVGQGYRIGAKTSFTTADGVRIACLFKAPANPAKKTVIMLHGLGSNQEEWQPFAHRLAAEGYGFLSYDARGHGESTVTDKGNKIGYESFGAPVPGSMWGRMVSDLDEVLRFLAREKKIPAAKIVLAGASLGANVCLIYGTMNTAVPAVIALSPGLNYAGFATERHIAGYSGRPVAIAASPGDTYAYQSSLLLYSRVEGNRKAAFIAGKAGHGVQMFDGTFETKLLRWMRNVN